MWVAFLEKCCIKRDQMMDFVTFALTNFYNLLQSCVEDIYRKNNVSCLYVGRTALTYVEYCTSCALLE